MVALIIKGKVMNNNKLTEFKQNQQRKLDSYYENITSLSLFEEDNIEIRKRLDIQKKKLEAEKRDPNKVYPFMEKSDTEKQIVDQKHQYWRAVYVRLNEGLVNKGECDHSFDRRIFLLISVVVLCPFFACFVSIIQDMCKKHIQYN